MQGWRPPVADMTWDDVPGANTPWQVVEGSTLSPDSPVTIAWENGAGLRFTRTFAVDENYMFTITQAVENTGHRHRAHGPLQPAVAPWRTVGSGKLLHQP